MKLPGFIPEELRQLARFVPLRGWDAIEWKPLLGSMRSVSWRYATGQGVGKLTQSSMENTTAIGFCDNLDDAELLADITGAKRLQRFGDQILRFYFEQWLVDDGLVPGSQDVPVR